MAGYLSSEKAKALGLEDEPTASIGYLDPKQAASLGLETAPQATKTARPSGADKVASVPEWGRKYPNLYGVAGAARETPTGTLSFLLIMFIIQKLHLN